MRSSTLIFILSIAFAFSVLGLFFLGFNGSFNGRGRRMSVEIPRSFWLVLFGVPLVVAVTALGYALLFPELGEERSKEKIPSVPAGEKEESALSAVLRVLNEDERKVIETLAAGGGTMLQKDIRWKTGLSRVKTHRILFRLGKRGIVTAEKYYNTNKIALADWLTKEPKKP